VTIVLGQRDEGSKERTPGCELPNSTGYEM
jgi:hypothetical protein